jgi:hypothetical protein
MRVGMAKEEEEEEAAEGLLSRDVHGCDADRRCGCQGVADGAVTVKAVTGRKQILQGLVAQERARAAETVTEGSSKYLVRLAQ